MTITLSDSEGEENVNQENINDREDPVAVLVADQPNIPKALDDYSSDSDEEVDQWKGHSVDSMSDSEEEKEQFVAVKKRKLDKNENKHKKL